MQIIPYSEPFLFQGNTTGCLLLHGFTCTPEEMRPLGADLAQRGYTVLGLRLSGHATHPSDLARTRWQDWLADIEAGLAILNGSCERVFVIGLSMGGLLALTAAARYPVAGVISMSAPYQAIFSPAQRRWLAATHWLRPLQHKPQEEQHPTLPTRREKNYPAYPAYPRRILLELDGLIRAMQAGLPQVQVPALLIHSHQDAIIAGASVEQIAAHLGSQQKEKLLLEGFDHALVQDPKRQVVFDAIAAFIERIAATKPDRHI